MSAREPEPATATALSGSALLEACAYDIRLTGAIIAQQLNWEQLLDTIPSPQLRKNAAFVTWQVRAALGEDFDHARDICQGRS